MLTFFICTSLFAPVAQAATQTTPTRAQVLNSCSAYKARFSGMADTYRERRDAFVAGEKTWGTDKLPGIISGLQPVTTTVKNAEAKAVADFAKKVRGMVSINSSGGLDGGGRDTAAMNIQSAGSAVERQLITVWNTERAGKESAVNTSIASIRNVHAQYVSGRRDGYNANITSAKDTYTEISTRCATLSGAAPTAAAIQAVTTYLSGLDRKYESIKSENKVMLTRTRDAYRTSHANTLRSLQSKIKSVVVKANNDRAGAISAYISQFNGNPDWYRVSTALPRTSIPQATVSGASENMEDILADLYGPNARQYSPMATQVFIEFTIGAMVSLSVGALGVGFIAETVIGQIANAVIDSIRAYNNNVPVATVTNVINSLMSQEDTEERAHDPNNPPGDMSCFTGDTFVLMGNGSQKAIADIVVGDTVLAFSEDGALVPQPVTRTWVHFEKEVIDVDGVKVTPEHRFLLPSGEYAHIGDLSVGDEVVNADGTTHVIGSIEAVSGTHTVYNLTVNDLHTYVAGGFRVHNWK